mgnify:CR=1 FL=1
MNLTQNQIEALKGKCPECDNGSIQGLDCPLCQGSGKATTLIEKEWVECPSCEGHGYYYFNSNNPKNYHNCRNCGGTPKNIGKSKLLKHNIGDEIVFCRECKKLFNCDKVFKDKCGDENWLILKIMPEGHTETKWRVCLG